MINLPTEIIIIIFSYLPQRYIKVGSTICKEWQSVLSQPHFYKTIHIYSLTQIKKCIQIAKTKTIENQPFSHYVENLYFHTDRKVPNQTIIKILNTFPNLHCIQGLKVQEQQYQNRLSSSRLTMYENQLEYLFEWYQDYIEHWMDTLERNHNKIKSLEFSFRSNLYVPYKDKEENQSSSLSSAKPIIHIIVKSTPVFSNSRLVDYKTYVLKLPMMSSLSHLSIHCSIYNDNEELFESIHQSCPKLKSLTLKHLNMFASENYRHRKPDQLFQPNVYLKELSIDYKINDPECFDYLSYKYPHLESLSLSLKEMRLSESICASLRLATYKMITQYGDLKKLKMIYDVSFQFQAWPHTELLEWLQRNPTQLYSLDYRYDFSVKSLEKDVNEDDVDNQYNFNPSKAIFRDLPIQEHDYLNHLSTLSLGNKSSNDTEALFYFYLCNHHNTNNFISNSVETLSLHFCAFSSIYFWLYGFPNLKSLSINGFYGISKVVDHTNIYSNSFYSKEMLYYLKNKLKQQQQSWMHTSTITEKETNSHFFNLQKLEIRCCNVHLENHGWDGFIKKLPNLKTIILCNINRVGSIVNKEKKKLVNSPLKDIFFDWSHLSLDLFKISYFNDQPYFFWKKSVPHFVKELKINETSLDKTYYVGPDNLFSDNPSYHSNSTTLHIKCKYIEHIDFHNN